MSEPRTRHALSLKPVVYRLEGMERVAIRRDIQYHQTETGPLTLDIYQPAASADSRPAPVVLFVSGLPDVGVSNPLGCLFKEVEMFVSLARLVASSGMAAVTYSTRHPVDDIERVIDYLDTNAGALNGDVGRLGLWAVSAHVPIALRTLMSRPRTFQAAVLSNGLTLDGEGTAIAEVFRKYGLVNPCAGRSVNDLPTQVPLFLTRSGRDEILGLNEALDRFCSAAITRNLPVTLVNHPTAPHCFELNADDALSRTTIVQMLAFMRSHLSAPAGSPTRG